MAQRKDEIQTAIDQWRSYSLMHQVSMITLTVPHALRHSLKRLLGKTKTRDGLAGAVARLKERATWKRDVDEFVSGFEITEGKNGPHPHFHILIFHTRPLDLNAWYESWAKACTDSGLGTPSRAHGLTVQPAESAAGYMAKWGISSEITGQHVKEAKHGNHSIFELEQLAAQGDKAARNRLKQYLWAMKRKRVHTFSRGLAAIRTRHRLEQTPAQPHFVFDKSTSFRLYEDRDLRACLLQVFEDYKMPAMQVFEDLGLAAQPVLYPAGEGPQFSYEIRQRAERLLNQEKPAKYPDVDKQCLELLYRKQSACKSVITPDTLDDLLDRLAAYDSS